MRTLTYLPGERRCPRPDCTGIVTRRGRRYCSEACAGAAILEAKVAKAARDRSDNPKACGNSHCGASFYRRDNETRKRFAAREYCSGACANIAIGEERHQSELAYGRIERVAVGPWRVFFTDRPTQTAGSLLEAKARGSVGDPRYAEIHNPDTGQYLIRFRGEWSERVPAGGHAA